MKICPNCGSSFDESMRFCLQCGVPLAEATAPAAEAAAPAQAEAAQPEAQAQAPFQQPAPGFVPPYPPPVAPMPVVNPDDHTGEMDPQDIAENKLYAMLVYLLGPVGIIIALLKDKESAFLKFHTRLAIKYLVAETLLSLLTAVLSFTIIGGIAGIVCLCIVAVLEIITFIQVCKGQAKDPAIIKNIKFLN